MRTHVTFRRRQAKHTIMCNVATSPPSRCRAAPSRPLDLHTYMYARSRDARFADCQCTRCSPPPCMQCLNACSCMHAAMQPQGVPPRSLQQLGVQPGELRHFAQPSGRAFSHAAGFAFLFRLAAAGFLLMMPHVACMPHHPTRASKKQKNHAYK